MTLRFATNPPQHSGIAAETLAHGNQAIKTARHTERTNHPPVAPDTTKTLAHRNQADATTRQPERTEHLLPVTPGVTEIADYAGSVGALRASSADWNHAQPDDPAKATRAIVDLAEVPDPPLQAQLAANSVAGGEPKLDLLRSELDTWRKVSLSTDHQEPPTSHDQPAMDHDELPIYHNEPPTDHNDA
jgi:hypothetical protein